MTSEAFNQGVTDSIKNLVAMNNKAQVNPLTQHPDGSPKWENPDTVMQRGDSYGIPYRAKLPESFEDWLKSNNDDIGGNEIPDRVAANHERYAQQGEKQSIPF